jgi:hypothetical protein
LTLSFGKCRIHWLKETPGTPVRRTSPEHQIAILFFGERKKRFHDSSKNQSEIPFRFRLLSSDLVLPIAAGPEAELKDDGSQ